MPPEPSSPPLWPPLPPHTHPSPSPLCPGSSPDSSPNRCCPGGQEGGRAHPDRASMGAETLPRGGWREKASHCCSCCWYQKEEEILLGSLETELASQPTTCSCPTTVCFERAVKQVTPSHLICVQYCVCSPHAPRVYMRTCVYVCAQITRAHVGCKQSGLLATSRERDWRHDPTHT